MSQHESVWLATAERPPYPQLGADIDVDVAVVGAGIAGLTTALLLQRQGARVAVVDAGRAGGGTTGGTTGKVTSQHSLTYSQLVQHHGEHRARLYAQANQDAIDQVEALIDQLGIDCAFRRAPSFVYASNADERAMVEGEHTAAQLCGLPASLTTETDLPFAVELALRFDDQAHFHPTRYTAGLAAAIAGSGGLLYEHSRVTDVTEDDDAVVARTSHGSIRASHLVVATLLPVVDDGGFFAKTRPARAYGIAATLASGGIDGMHITAGSPTRSTRPWLTGDRPGLIVVGENHETGAAEATPGRWGELERWTREHFDVEAFSYRWSAQDYTTADDIPYVGRSPRMSRTFVATGFRKWGLTNATAGARILADLIAGRDNPWLEAFDATRIGDARTVAELVKDNLHVGRRFVQDWAGRLTADAAAQLPPGQGDLVQVDGRTVAAYRDPGGALHAVSATCTHMGCTVQWNGAETSWDCPCHGSRFATDGTVLNGPAVSPLEPVEADDQPA